MRRILTGLIFPLIFLLALSMAGVSVGGAQDASVSPTINQNFKSDDLDVEGWATRFSGESREAFHARHDVVKAMALKPGEAVADVGAGTGIYTRLFAQAVGPSGTVTATDLAPKFLSYIAANAAKEGLKNVRTLQAGDRSSNLPPSSMDVIFHSDVYHHFEYPMVMNADLLRALKPGGRLYVLEMEKEGGNSGHVRAPKAAVIAEIEKSGFVLVGDLKVPGLKENYLLQFRKR